MSEVTITSERPPLGLIFGSLLRADFTVLLRSGRTLALNALLPLLILVITALGKQDRFGTSEFVIGMAVTYGLLASDLLGYALTMSRDRDLGVFQRLRVTPAPTWTIMTSRLSVQLIVNLVITIIVIIAGSIIHHISFTVGQYLLFLAAAIIGGAVFLSIGQAMVGLLKSATVVNAVGRILLIALVLIGLLGATGLLGSAFQTFADWTPVGALFNLFAGALNISAWSGTNTNALIACLAYIAVFSFIGIRWFHWDSQ